MELYERNYDPLRYNLVVADSTRTEKTICLAVSPSLKAYGIPGRARLFEVSERVREINAARFSRALSLGLLPRDPQTGKYTFSSSSCDAAALEKDPSLKMEFMVAPPRMLLYEKISTRIYKIYLNYVSPQDIHVYSIDECFIDLSGYLGMYGLSARELVETMILDILHHTGITAAAGIGSNLYLAKIAMDIVAKHVPPDQHGVRIAELDEIRYRELLWCHTPLTDFWRVGAGIARRLSSLGCCTMGDIARMSLFDEGRLYNELGMNAELLIDHAWGYEPTEISMIKSYRPENNSLSSGQVLMEPYDKEKAKLIVREMTESLVLDLVRKDLVTRQIVLTIGYDRTSLIPSASHANKGSFIVAKTGLPYTGEVTEDGYGRPVPKSAHASGNLDRWTSSTRKIMETMMSIYDRIADPDLLVRRLTIAACGLIPVGDIPLEEPVQLDLFTDYARIERERKEESAGDRKEKALQQAALAVQDKFGKNALLKGMSLQQGATATLRNEQIGGHRSGTVPGSGKEDELNETGE